jgi:hypothetical protein
MVEHLLFAALAGAVLGTPIPAKFEFVPPATITWSGDMFREDYVRFSNFLEKHPRFDVIEIRDSRGGDVKTTSLLSETIRGLGIRVNVRGRCVSACTLVFMSGKVRSFAAPHETLPTYLHIHGIYNPNTGVPNGSDSQTRRMYEIYQRGAEGRIPVNWLQRAITVQDPRGGLLIFDRPMESSRGVAEVFFCKGPEAVKPYLCEPVPDATAQSWGITSGHAKTASGN